MNLVNEFIEIVLVSTTQVNEGLNGLVGVCGHVLALSSGENRKHVIKEGGEVRNRIVDVGRLVDSDKQLVEDRKEIAEKVKCD